MKEQSKLKTEAGLWLSLTKNHYNNLLIDHLGGFCILHGFWIHISSILKSERVMKWLLFRIDKIGLQSALRLFDLLANTKLFVCCQQIDLWSLMRELFWNPFYCWPVKVLCIVTALHNTQSIDSGAFRKGLLYKLSRWAHIMVVSEIPWCTITNHSMWWGGAVREITQTNPLTSFRWLTAVQRGVCG